jgi:hypothetical protein
MKMVIREKGWSIHLVHRTLELKFENRQVPCLALHAQANGDARVESLTARSLFHRDGMLRCCFSRLQRPSRVLRFLCVSHLCRSFIRFVDNVLASIPISLITSVAQSPKHRVFKSPYPPVQFLASGSSVVSSRPQILRDTLQIYAPLVLSASFTLARTLEGC